MNRLNLIFRLATLVIALGLISACGKDQRVEDWQKDQVQKGLSEIEPAAGTYAGTAISKKDGSDVGALKITLEAKTQVLASSDGTKADEKPVLSGTIEAFRGSASQLVAADSYYDPATGRYQAQISVPESPLIQLEGKVEGGVFEGSLSAQGYEDAGLAFKLARQDSNAASATQAADSAGDSGLPGMSLVILGGSTRFQDADSTELPVQLVIVKPKSATRDDLLDVLTPVKTVEVTLNYGNAVELYHGSARWDTEAGTLVGESDLPSTAGAASAVSASSPARLKLECAADGKTWTCRHYSTSQGLVAVTRLETSTRHEPASLAIVDGADLLEVYDGALDFGGRSEPVQLQILRPRKTAETFVSELFMPRTREKTQIALVFGPTFMLQFADATLDFAAGTLSGDALLAGVAPIHLDCARLEDRQGPWNCSTYSSAFGLTSRGRFDGVSGTKSHPIPEGASAEPVRVETFAGELDFEPRALGSPAPRRQDVELTIRYEKKTWSQRMQELFIPLAQEPVTASIKFSKTIELAVASPVLDARAGTFTGSYTLTRSNGLRFEITIDCRRSESTEPALVAGWDCAHLATANGRSARSAFARITPTETTTPTTPPVTEATSQDFSGRARWSSDGSEADSRLTLLLPALSRADELVELFYPGTERSVQAFLSLVKSGASVLFDGARWDVASGTIDGTASFVRSGETFRLTLRCRGIRSLEQARGEGFRCRYFSDHLAGYVEIELPKGA